MLSAKKGPLPPLFRLGRSVVGQPIRWRQPKREHASSSSSAAKAGQPDGAPPPPSSQVTHQRQDSTQPLLVARRHRQEDGARKRSSLAVPGATLVGAAVFYLWRESREVRRWRAEQIGLLPLARDAWAGRFPRRPAGSVAPIVERCGLMGRTRSVRTDLERIRAWHVANGYAGGLVLRDLSLPAFFFDDGDDAADASSREEEEKGPSESGQSSTKAPKPAPSSHGAGAGDRGSPSGPSPSNKPSPSYPTMTVKDWLTDPARLARRECYYLYYEVTGDGQQKQQIFCRGTTILMDVVTCLEAWMSYDPELRVRLHRGFARQADRVLEDVVPLLASPNDRRATVEVCGHSLGGAVATIVAAKLRRRGYRVVRVTTAGSPRFCATEADAARLLEMLPPDYLRVEQEFDFVPFLPPFGAHVGDKLWLLADGRGGGGGGARLATKRSHAWSDSVWRNFLAWEIVRWGGTSHRVPAYTASLRANLAGP